MRFLVDAQLPPPLNQFIIDKGFDNLHTLQLPLTNDTDDNFIRNFLMKEQRVLITKDKDFYYSILENRGPYKLVFIKIDNISRNKLLTLFELHFYKIVKDLNFNDIVELDSDSVLPFE